MKIKSKVPALILALGMTATPVFAKQSNRRADNKSSSQMESKKLSKKRAEKAYKRHQKIELEKKYIKEVEEEISDILSEILKENEEAVKARLAERPAVVITEKLPVNGIDISEHFRKIKHVSESS